MLKNISRKKRKKPYGRYGKMNGKEPDRKSQEAETACGFSVLMKLSGRLPEYTKIIIPCQKNTLSGQDLIAAVYPILKITRHIKHFTCGMP